MNKPTGLAPAAGMRLDRRLLRWLSGQQAAVMALLLITALLAMTITASAWLLSQSVAQAFLHGAGLDGLKPNLILLIGLACLRALLVYLRHVGASRLSGTIRQRLRWEILEKVSELGPAFSRSRPSGELAAVLTDGIESLDPYFSAYLPQLATTTLVPIAILLAVLPLDPLSGVVLLLTAPLIPFFMMLIGRSAENQMQARWRQLQRMSGFFLERLQGLPALKILGQSRAQLERIGQVSEQFRRATLSVLRVAFLSALVLELAATLSTAIIAVQIGLRLLAGSLSFQVGFFILLLAPEYYLPMRQLGAHFHDSVSGLTAADDMVDILEQSNPGLQAPTAAQTFHPETIEVEFNQVTFQHQDRPQAALVDFNLNLKPNSLTAVIGPSGAGKSTIIQLLLRFLQPQAGIILANGQPIDRINAADWRHLIAWVPQRPYLKAASLEDNLRLGLPHASQEQLARAARQAGLAPFIDSLPAGMESAVGEQGLRLSGGQAQRLALARALLRPAPLLLLDEPTSDLDAATEELILDTLRRLRTQRTILWISHRLKFTLEADQVLLLAGGHTIEQGKPDQLIQRDGRYAQLTSKLRGVAP